MKTPISIAFRRTLSVLGAFIVGSACADTWYVDASKYGSSGDGRSSGTAFGTIQEGVDAAADGDTVMLAPGRYDRGEVWDGYQMSRVAISNKFVTITSSGSREDTFIVGRRSTDPTGFGSDAIRCVYTANAAGTRIRNVTLQDGCSSVDVGDPRGQGGGVYAGSINAGVFLLDCTVRNCFSRGGAALLGGGAIRCLIVGNARKSGSNGCIARSGILINCICANNDLGGQPGVQGGVVLNSTFFGNGSGNLFSEGTYLANVLSTHNDKNLGNATAAYPDLRWSVFGGNALYGDDVSPKTEGLVTDAAPAQMFAPALGDCRPIVGSVAATGGRSEPLAEYAKIYGIPADEIYADYSGAPIPTEGVIACGAVQAAAPAPTCGALAFGKGGFRTFGFPAQADGVYFYPQEGLKMQRVTKADFGLGETDDVMWYWLEKDAKANFRPLLLDDSFYLMPPALPEMALTNGLVVAEKTIFVDQEKGSDTANDGSSPTAAYKSIAKALAETPRDGTKTVIRVAAGVYDEANEGVQTAQGHNTRVVIRADQAVRLVGAGANRSFIVGKEDSGHEITASDAPGCGPDACRVYADVAVTGKAEIRVIQGFTLQDGRTDLLASAVSEARSGAAASFVNEYGAVSDCRIENCQANRAIVNSGRLFRTAFDGCYGWNGGLRGLKALVSCTFVNTPGSSAGAVIYGDTGYAAISHCTGILPADAGNVSVWNGAAAPTFNCVFSRGFKVVESPGSDTIHFGCLVWNYVTPPVSSRYWGTDPVLASDDDPRPIGYSPVFFGGEPLEGDSIYTRNYHLWAVGDVNGYPIEIIEGVRPVIGACQRPVNLVSVTEPAFGSISPSGTVALEAGESATFVYTRDTEHATRPYLGLAVNGEPLSTGLTCTFTMPEIGRIPTAYAVTALLSTNWYVNAVSGSDTNSGWTAETAKKTLAAAMACDLMAGDVVHAARGDYDSGRMAYSDDTASLGITSNRVVVASNIALVADEGPSVTRILGENGTNPNAFGRGTGAVRCAVVCADGVLDGFTLENGNTSLGNETGASVDRDGGGVYVPNAASSKVVIRNCVITSCAANRGGGAMNGTFVNCRFTQNASIGAGQGDASRSASYYGCYVGRQRSSNGSQSVVTAEQTTFDDSGANNLTATSTFRNCLFRNTSGDALYVRPASEGDAHAPKLYNCLFDEEHCATWTNKLTNPKTVFDRCAAEPLENLQLDDDGAPVRGACAAIDAGDASIVANLSRYAGVDALGKPRVLNGSIDIGAMEFDWRPAYAEKLGVGTTVTAASSDVTLEDGGVRLPAGASLAATVTDAATQSGAYGYAFALADASLTRTLGDETVTHTTDGSVTLRHQPATVDFLFTAEGSGSALLTKLGVLPKPGFLLMIR